MFHTVWLKCPSSRVWASRAAENDWQPAEPPRPHHPGAPAWREVLTLQSDTAARHLIRWGLEHRSCWRPAQGGVSEWRWNEAPLGKIRQWTWNGYNVIQSCGCWTCLTAQAVRPELLSWHNNSLYFIKYDFSTVNLHNKCCFQSSVYFIGNNVYTCRAASRVLFVSALLLWKEQNFYCLGNGYFPLAL